MPEFTCHIVSVLITVTIDSKRQSSLSLTVEAGLGATIYGLDALMWPQETNNPNPLQPMRQTSYLFMPEVINRRRAWGRVTCAFLQGWMLKFKVSANHNQTVESQIVWQRATTVSKGAVCVKPCIKQSSKMIRRSLSIQNSSETLPFLKPDIWSCARASHEESHPTLSISQPVSFLSSTTRLMIATPYELGESGLQIHISLQGEQAEVCTTWCYTTMNLKVTFLKCLALARQGNKQSEDYTSVQWQLSRMRYFMILLRFHTKMYAWVYYYVYATLAHLMCSNCCNTGTDELWFDRHHDAQNIDHQRRNDNQQTKTCLRHSICA